MSQKRDTMIDYLKMKVDQEDWHAVWDAAIDLYRIDTWNAVKSKVKVTPENCPASQDVTAMCLCGTYI